MSDALLIPAVERKNTINKKVHYIFFLDLSNRISRDVVRDKLTPPSLWMKRRAKTAQLELIYEYRVVCDEFYYSDTCEQICRHRNDNFGHYVCDETGSKVCLPGWQGEFCQEGIGRQFLEKSAYPSTKLKTKKQ